MRSRAFVSLMSLLVLGNSSYAQEKEAEPVPAAQSRPATRPAAKNRLKIGVALEGGGALGIAHIGVLKWFEQHHIPVDYVAGTSMGGLVGGLYATGKSADELKQIVDNQDWPLLLGGEIPYPELSFRRKEDARDVPNSLKIGLKNGPRLPPGLNTGEQISLLIDRETLNYSTVPSFDELPIPFRCVSTELVSGKAYVFDQGSLSEAMRATMSIPRVFDPVRQGNMVLRTEQWLGEEPDQVRCQQGVGVKWDSF